MPKAKTKTNVAARAIPLDPSMLFLMHFESMKDPRKHQHKVLYPLPLLLLIGFGAALCGLKDWDAAADFAEEKEDWAERPISVRVR